MKLDQRWQAAAVCLLLAGLTDEEWEEQVTINKIPIVIEEITLTKRVLQEMKQITENVQREKVRIERRGNVHIQGDNIDDVSLQSSQGE